MYIERLELKNFRNYDSIELDFSSKINVLIGENAQGKTNLMESLYVLSMAKSHRTSNDKELIRWEAEYGKIIGDICPISMSRKRLRICGLPFTRNKSSGANMTTFS